MPIAEEHQVQPLVVGPVLECLQGDWALSAPPPSPCFTPREHLLSGLLVVSALQSDLSRETDSYIDRQLNSFLLNKNWCF